MKLKAKKLKAKEADIETANVTTADINTLNVSNIVVDGKDLTCALQAQPVTQITDPLQFLGITGNTGPVTPIIPDNVNPAVFNCLLNNAIDYRADLQDRIFQGRTFINNYLANYPCPQTCPPAPTGPVPLELYGILTLPIYNRKYCGFTGTTGPSGSTGVTGTSFNDFYNTAVNFNLQVTYLLEEARSIDARNVSVLVQVGYVDPLGPTGGLFGCTGVTGGENVVISEVFVANRQFYPTLDVLYGENFANNIAIPANLLNNAYFNSNPTSQGAIMMAIYKEEGLCIWTPKGDGTFECLGGGGPPNNNPPAGNSSQSSGNKCAPGYKLCEGGDWTSLQRAPLNCFRCDANTGPYISCDTSKC